MSDEVICDVCGAIGKRRRFTLTDEDWSYAEIVNDADPDNPLQNRIASTCSDECRGKFWTKGPGRFCYECSETLPVGATGRCAGCCTTENPVPTLSPVNTGTPSDEVSP